jgi:glycosyltransferase involved in cell wall biosynthesis
MTPRDILMVGFLPALAHRREAGGMGIVGVDLANALCDRGHRVRVLTPIAEGAAPPRSDDFGAAIEASVYAVPEPIHDPSSLAHFEMHGAAIRAAMPHVLAKGCPDAVLVTHMAYAHAFPVVVAGPVMPWAVWVQTGPVMAPVNGFGSATPPMALVEQIRSRLRQANLLVAVADHVAVELLTLGTDRVASVPNGVDLTQFRPRPPVAALRHKMRLSKDDIVVLHASNLKYSKRIPDLVGAAVRAYQRDPRLAYVILGEGPYRAEIEDGFAAAGSSDRLRLPGWLPRDAVPDYLSLADIVVLSSHIEGLPLTVLEAQASGRAVIASDIPAWREIIRDDETGILFPVGNVNALTRCLLDLASDSDRRKRIGANARRFVERHHDVRSMTDRFEELIDKVVLTGSRLKRDAAQT